MEKAQFLALTSVSSLFSLQLRYEKSHLARKLETFLQGKLRVSPWETYCIYKGALWTCKDKNKTPHWLAIPIINMVTNICRIL